MRSDPPFSGALRARHPRTIYTFWVRALDPQRWSLLTHLSLREGSDLDPTSAAVGRMKWRHVVLIVFGVAASTSLYILIPFPDSSAVPVLVLMEAYAPFLLLLMHGWYFAMPGVMLAISGMLVLGIWRVWFEAAHQNRAIKGALPPWPTSPSDEKLSLVVGEVHHPVEAREVARPKWLVIPERGLFTGMAIFGAVGSGKTSACMRPFAEQLFSLERYGPGASGGGPGVGSQRRFLP